MKLDDHYLELCAVAVKKLRDEIAYLHSYNETQGRLSKNFPLVNTTGFEENVSFLESMFGDK